MRVIVHDFSGHPFQAELARSLARRGHQVLHAQCTSYTSGKGSFVAEEGQADENPRFVALSLDKPFERYRTTRRITHELIYARAFAKEAKAFKPDLVISCNDPLLAKLAFGMWAARRRVPWIFWLQDLYSVAMAREAARRSRAGRALGVVLQRVERGLLRNSDAVVAITDDFDATLDAWGVRPEARTVIENWAPLDELPPRERDNQWRKEMGFEDRFLFLYAGTLGMKHNPDVLHALAEAEPTADVVVVSEGLGAERLQALLKVRPLDNLHLLPFQPWEALPDVLGAADVLLVLLEAGAGAFSVPSKILTCLCAGRPILAAVPAANLGARTIRDAGAGLVVAPGEPEQFLAAARKLREDAGTKGTYGSIRSITRRDGVRHRGDHRSLHRRDGPGRRASSWGGGLMKRALVTGGGGFIGGHLVRRLEADGVEVRAADVKPLDAWYQISDTAESLQLDVSTQAAAEKAVQGVDTVFNLAADMGGMGFIENNKALCMLSVLTSTHVLVEAQKAGVDRLFYSSSACVYAAEHQTSPEVVPLKEEDAYPAQPEDGYGWEKLFSERMCRHFEEDYGMTTRVARYHNIYGPEGTWTGGREKAPAAISRKVAQAVISGDHSIEIWGDGLQTRSFTYIDDCLEGTLRLTASDVTEPLNVGSDELVTINQLVDIVEGIAGVKLERTYLTDAPQGVRGRNSDNTRINKLLGWAPAITLEYGLEQTYRWVYDQVKAAS